MLGTDYPFPLGEMDGNGRLVATAKISEEIKKKIFFTNTLDFFGSNVDKEFYESV